AGDFALLEHHHVTAGPGQMVGRSGAHYAAANHDHFSGCSHGSETPFAAGSVTRAPLVAPDPPRAGGNRGSRTSWFANFDVDRHSSGLLEEEFQLKGISGLQIAPQPHEHDVVAARLQGDAFAG